MTLFNGGKDAGSKIRFSKFYLIVDLAPQDLLMDTGEGSPEKFDAYKAVMKLNSNIEKAIATQKNAPAFKKSNEGAWFNAFDGVNECFKLIED